MIYGWNDSCILYSPPSSDIQCSNMGGTPTMHHFLFSCVTDNMGHIRRDVWCKKLITTMNWSWRRLQMETFSALLVLCEGNPPVTGGFPSQRPVTWSFDVFVDLAWPNDWTKNRDGGDLRRHHAHFDVTVMFCGMRPYLISKDDLLSIRLPRDTIQCVSYHDKMVFIKKMALENTVFIMSAIFFRTQYVKWVQIPWFPG